MKITAGLLVTHYSLSTDAFADGVLNGGTSSYSIDTNEIISTPNFELKFKPAKDRFYCIRTAKGFRLAHLTSRFRRHAVLTRPRSVSPRLSSVSSDTRWSYEAGAKQSFAGGKEVVNASVFHIDWKGRQAGFLLPNCGFAFAGNTGSASSQGVELDYTWRVSRGLTLNGAASYTDAKLKEDAPSSTGVGGKRGDRLPSILRWSVQGRRVV